MTNQDRVKAVVEFGFTERQARFLVIVMLHSGACLLATATIVTTAAGVDSSRGRCRHTTRIRAPESAASATPPLS